MWDSHECFCFRNDYYSRSYGLLRHLTFGANRVFSHRFFLTLIKEYLHTVVMTIPSYHYFTTNKLHKFLSDVGFISFKFLAKIVTHLRKAITSYYINIIKRKDFIACTFVMKWSIKNFVIFIRSLMILHLNINIWRLNYSIGQFFCNFFLF